MQLKGGSIGGNGIVNHSRSSNDEKDLSPKKRCKSNVRNNSKTQDIPSFKSTTLRFPLLSHLLHSRVVM